MPLVKYELNTTNNVALLTLNDPESLNAMGEDMAREFVAITAQIKALKSRPRAIVLTGAGRAFSAGGRLEMLDKKRSLSKEDNKRIMLEFYHSFLGILKLKIPLVAMINGHAIGAGLCVAAACDIRIAAAGSKLGFTFSKLGLHPGMAATYFLPRLVGVSKATELLITGKIIDAEEGGRIGLISTVVPADQVKSAVDGVVNEILGSGPQTIEMLLETLRGEPAALEAALLREATCQSVSYASAEFAEGVKAAMEKRAPKF